MWLLGAAGSTPSTIPGECELRRSDIGGSRFGGVCIEETRC